MSRRISIVSMMCLLVATTAASAAFAEHSQVPVMRFHSQVEVAATPAAVWAWMTQGRNMVTWCPQWKAPANAKMNISKVGDVLDYMDEWGNGGRSVVTYMVANKELRIAHEPNKGDYMCQAKFVLEPMGARTRVHMWEQYTDESSPTDMKATAEKMEAEFSKMLAALKQGVEKK